MGVARFCCDSGPGHGNVPHGTMRQLCCRTEALEEVRASGSSAPKTSEKRAQGKHFAHSKVFQITDECHLGDTKLRLAPHSVCRGGSAGNQIPRYACLPQAGTG